MMTVLEVEGRRAAVLNAVVSEYIDAAQPVGSAHLASATAMHVSAATLRSDMALLEREGYLAQPHVSAGRVPTERGFRFYVDHLARPARLNGTQRTHLRRSFERLDGDTGDVLEKAGALLARITGSTSVVVAETRGASPARFVQLVRLSSQAGLLVMVRGDGVVVKRDVRFPVRASEEEIARASAVMNDHYAGKVSARCTAPAPTGVHRVDLVVKSAAGLLARMERTEEEPEYFFIGGPSRVAASFDAVGTIEAVLSILEQQVVITSLLRGMLARGMSVAIGLEEHGVQPLSPCALVVSPVTFDGGLAGAFGVLGPIRMDYRLALAAVNEVGEQIVGRLGDSEPQRASDATGTLRGRQ